VKVIQTSFEGLLIIEPEVYKDSRGYFFESYNRKSFLEAGIDIVFVQDNQSHSTRNVVRGLHFQRPPHAQAKLIRVLHGVIWDVVVDLRQDQSTFRQVFTFELSSENRKQLLIPAGFAHGFSVLSETAEILYKCDEYYRPRSAAGIIYNDPELSIDWKVSGSDCIVSENDLALPTLSSLSFSS
jgi:dTDP-4-dehydrorhamnose 3,5-epimerase